MSDVYSVLATGGLLFLLSGLRFIISFFSPQGEVPDWQDSPPASGPFDLLLRGVEQCPKDIENEKVFNLKSPILAKQGGQSTITCDIIMKEPLSDDFDIQTEVAALDYRARAYRHVRMFEMRGVCTSMQYFSNDLFMRVLEATNVTECPIPPGSYQLMDVPLEVFRPLALYKFPYGHYRTTAYITEKQRILGCSVFYFDIVPAK